MLGAYRLSDFPEIIVDAFDLSVDARQNKASPSCEYHVHDLRHGPLCMCARSLSRLMMMTTAFIKHKDAHPITFRLPRYDYLIHPTFSKQAKACMQRLETGIAITPAVLNIFYPPNCPMHMDDK